VDAWAKPYVGFAYANGLTSGTSTTTYSGNATVTASQYITFVLRALGYDSKTDFQWDKAWEFSDEIGLTDGRYNAETTEFLRGDAAIISYNSLSCQRKENIFIDIPAETETQRANFAVMSKYWDRRYGFPESSKGLTLSWEQARALVGQDLETVKQYVKTLEDCLYYMCAAGYSQGSGDLQYRDNTNPDIEWHFTPSPAVVFERNEGSCGGTSGLVAYLLEGDYDEVGFATCRSRVGDGGHVVNCLKNGDVYYVVDINQFADGYDKGLNFQNSTDLNEAVKEAFGIESSKPRNHPAMMAYTYTGCFGGNAPTGWPDGPKTYIIKDYAEKVNIVYETPEEGYVYEYIEVSQRTLDMIEKIRNEK